MMAGSESVSLRTEVLRTGAWMPQLTGRCDVLTELAGFIGD